MLSGYINTTPAYVDWLFVLVTVIALIAMFRADYLRDHGRRRLARIFDVAAITVFVLALVAVGLLVDGYFVFAL